MSLSFHLVDTTYGTLAPALTSRVVDAELERTLAGDATLRLALRAPSLVEQFLRYDRPGVPDLEAWEAGGCAWRGRVEDVAVTSDRGLLLTAYGPQRALDDLPYVALWSDTSLERWRKVTTQEESSRDPDRYTFDTQNRLQIGNSQDGSYHNGAVGSFTYETPDGSDRLITYVQFNFAAVLPNTTWRARVTTWARDFTSPTVVWSSDGTASAAGVVVGPFTGQPRLMFELFYNSGVAVALSDQAGSYYARWTDVRVLTQAAPVRATDIAGHMVGLVAAANVQQLSGETSLIQATTNDAADARYEDASMRDVLAELAAREGWVYGVDRERRLYLRPAETAETIGAGGWARLWRVNVSQLELRRVLDQLQNSVYAVYDEPGGTKRRSAAATDTQSTLRWGLVRRGALTVRTTSATLAQTLRDAALADRKDPAPRARIVFDRPRAVAGAPVARSELAAGDILLLGNLSARLSAGIDQVAAFRVARVRHTLTRGRRPALEVEPVDPPRTLEVLLARQEAGWL